MLYCWCYYKSLQNFVLCNTNNVKILTIPLWLIWFKIELKWVKFELNWWVVLLVLLMMCIYHFCSKQSRYIIFKNIFYSVKGLLHGCFEILLFLMVQKIDCKVLKWVLEHYCDWDQILRNWNAWCDYGMRTYKWPISD